MSAQTAVTLAALSDVEVNLTVSVGHARCKVSDVLALRPESVVSLESKADAPVELLVNGVAVALGDIVELDDGTLGIQISDVYDSSTMQAQRR